MKLPNLLITIVLACMFYSCGAGKNISPSQQSLILGTWTLQQEHMVTAINGKTQTDTTINASAANRCDVSFNASGTFTSPTYYNSLTTGGILSAPPEIASDTVRGVYSFAGNQFSMNPSIIGFIIFGGAGFPTGSPGATPVFILASHTIKISQLSQSALTLQFDNLYNETSPTAGTYEIVTMYSFTR
jgi:hypothetical protein